MDTWTRQMGFPVVHVKHVRGRTYRLEQKRFLLNPADKYDPKHSPYRWIHLRSLWLSYRPTFLHHRKPYLAPFIQHFINT